MNHQPPSSTPFPTRRSSDLGPVQAFTVTSRDGVNELEWLNPASAYYGTTLLRYRTRSEEHTSELQSPVHLVCRLLLEKKNNNLYNTLKSNHYSCKATQNK